jgi:hypothetical protein
MQQLKRPSTIPSKVLPATERQSVTTEVTRYDYLKKAAGTYILQPLRSIRTKHYSNSRAANEVSSFEQS